MTTTTIRPPTHSEHDHDRGLQAALDAVAQQFGAAVVASPTGTASTPARPAPPAPARPAPPARPSPAARPAPSPEPTRLPTDIVGPRTFSMRRRDRQAILAPPVEQLFDGDRNAAAIVRCDRGIAERVDDIG